MFKLQMGNCMNLCMPRSSKDDHRDKNMETTTTPHPQKQPRREVVELKGDRTRTKGVMISESLKTSDGEGNRKVHDTQENGRGNDGTVRVKIVLTKEELQWLMVQLKSDGEKRLENMLEEIEKGRKKVVCDSGKGNGWKPSLESIMETPECVLETNQSIRL